MGSRIDLVRETDNRYDPEAVALYFRGVHIGYIPSRQNAVLSIFTEMGWGAELFECRVSKIDPQAHYEEQLHVVVRVKRKPADKIRRDESR